MGCATGQFAVVGSARLFPHGKNDACRRLSETIDIGRVVASESAQVGHERIGAVPGFVGRHPELRGVGCGLREVDVVDLPAMHRDADEFRHGPAHSGRVVGGHDVGADGGDRGPVRERAAGGGFVGDERAHRIGMALDAGKGVDGATAGGEHVDRTGTESDDQGVEVVRVLLGRHGCSGLVAPAAAGIARVVGDDGTVRDPGLQRCEPDCIHR